MLYCDARASITLSDAVSVPQSKELAQLRQAMTEERRQLLLSLHAREDTLKQQYSSHVKQLEERQGRKVDLILKRHSTVSFHVIYTQLNIINS